MRYIFGYYIFFVIMFCLFNYQEQQPDEWYQTIDIANLLINKWTVSDAAFTHHRNLFIGFLLTVPVLAAKLLSDSPFFTFFFCKLFIAILNFIVLWGMTLLWKKECPEDKLGLKIIAGAFLLWNFSIEEASRPSLEHFSSIFFWAMVACSCFTSNLALFGMGFFAAAIGLARYPSGFLGVIYLAAVGYILLKNRHWKKIFMIGLGSFVSLGIGAMLDLTFYGRPFESLYMYFLYNVSSGLASLEFGEQSPFVYATYLWKSFSPAYLPFFPLFLWGVGLGCAQGLRQRKPWFLALLVAMLAHLFATHKEPRFFSAFLFILIFTSVWGLRHKLKVLCYNKFIQVVFWICFTIGTGRMLEISVRQAKSARFVLSWLQIPDSSCLITHRPYPAFMYPKKLLSDSEANIGFIASEDNQKIHWLKGSSTSCPTTTILTREAHPLLDSCAVDSSFFFNAVTYTCSTDSIKEKFSHEVSANYFRNRFNEFVYLPPLNIDARALKQFIKREQEML